MTDERDAVERPASDVSMTRAARGLLLAGVALVQLWLGHRYFGFLTGDELEVLEEAFRRATHIAFAPWEVRNLFVPDVVVAPVIWLAATLGMTDVRHIIEVASLPFVALTALTIVLVRRLALQWSGGDERAATLAMLLFALHWIPLGFGATTYPRTLATACIVAAAVVAGRAPLLAGALAGVAFADRFSEIVFVVPLMLLAAHAGPSGDIPGKAPATRWRQVVAVALGAAISISVSVGLYDWLTWGSPFRSALRFAHLTVVEPDFASRVKYQSPLWYVTNLLRWLAPTMLPLLWLARRRAHWLFVIVPLVALSCVRHKELRYVQSMIPVLAVAGAIGASMLWERRRALALALVAISVAWNLAGLRAFTRKTQPAVMAAQWLAKQPVTRLVTSQLWAYGDRLYLGTAMDLTDIGSPPQNPAAALVRADWASLWETDLDRRDLTEALAANGFRAVRTFHDGAARGVIIFRRIGKRPAAGGLPQPSHDVTR